MINIKQFDHIQMDVASLEESLQFYEKVFGFRLVEIGLRASTRWAITGNANGLYLCMHEYPEGRGKANEGLEITHFGLVVEDFDNVQQSLVTLGANLVYQEPVTYHSSRSVYFYDPNGYKIEISEVSGGGLNEKWQRLYG